MILVCSKLHEQNHLLFNDYIKDSFEILNDCWDQSYGKLCRTEIVMIEDIIHNPDYKMENLNLPLIQEEANEFQ